MAFRLNACITHGWIDNRGEGSVSAELCLVGREHPVVLDLEGNCLRDIAGCRVSFKNPSPDEQQDMDALNRTQQGWTGDITASRRVRLDIPKTYKGRPLDLQGLPRVEAKPGEPTPMGNCLYIEWYSRQNGRVVIEAVGFEVNIDDGPVWTMTDAEERVQSQNNLAAFGRFLDQANAALEDQSFTEEDISPADEHDWEQILRESDERTERYGELFDQYRDHPDRERIVAREMGWDWLDDAFDADARGLFDEARKQADLEPDHFEEPEPDPLTEGKDWIRTASGRIAHPLQNRVFEFSSTIWRRCKDHGVVGEEDSDPDVQEMLFQVQTLGAKLAGALNGLAQDGHVDPGFVIAYLKRALPFINDGVAAAQKVREKGLLPAEELDEYCTELLAVRQEILDLMQHFRGS